MQNVIKTFTFRKSVIDMEMYKARKAGRRRKEAQSQNAEGAGLRRGIFHVTHDDSER